MLVSKTISSKQQFWNCSCTSKGSNDFLKTPTDDVSLKKTGIKKKKFIPQCRCV